MFTGLVEGLGKVRHINYRGDILSIEVAHSFKQSFKKGDSIAIQGACLTVTGEKPTSFTVQITEETKKRTTLSKLRCGNLINLERPLKASDRFGGHILLGHIDTVGRVSRINRKRNVCLLTVKYPKEYSSLITEKGSVGVDGVSLTVANAADDYFTVSLIPYTIARTTLGTLRIGSEVNLEFDILLKAITGFKRRNNEREKSLSRIY